MNGNRAMMSSKSRSKLVVPVVNARIISSFGLIGLLIATAWPSQALDGYEFLSPPDHLIGEAKVHEDIPANLVSFVIEAELEGTSAHELMDDLVARRAKIEMALGSGRFRNAETIDVRIKPYPRLEPGFGADSLVPTGYMEVEEYRGSASMKFLLLTAEDPVERLKKIGVGQISDVRLISLGSPSSEAIIADLKAKALSAAIADARKKATQMDIPLGEPNETEYRVSEENRVTEDHPFHRMSVRAIAHYPHKIRFPRIRPDPDAEEPKWIFNRGGLF